MGKSDDEHEILGTLWTNLCLFVHGSRGWEIQCSCGVQVSLSSHEKHRCLRYATCYDHKSSQITMWEILISFYKESMTTNHHNMLWPISWPQKCCLVGYLLLLCHATCHLLCTIVHWSVSTVSIKFWDTRPGKHTKNNGKSSFFMGKLTINGDFL